MTYQLRLGCFTLACVTERKNSLPTVDDVVVSTRSKRLSIRSPRETTDLGSVSDEFSDLVSGDSDVVVMDRPVSAARAEQVTVPREDRHAGLNSRERCKSDLLIVQCLRKNGRKELTA